MIKKNNQINKTNRINQIIKKAKRNLQDHNNKFSLRNILNSKECDTCLNVDFGYYESCRECCYSLTSKCEESNKNFFLGKSLYDTYPSLFNGYYVNKNNNSLVIGLFFDNGVCATGITITESTNNDNKDKSLILTMDDNVLVFYPRFKSIFKLLSKKFNRINCLFSISSLSDLSKDNIPLSINNIADILDKETLYTRVNLRKDFLKYENIKTLAMQTMKINQSNLSNQSETNDINIREIIRDLQ